MPVVSSTVAWFVLDEYLSPTQWVGAAVALGALVLVVPRAVRPAGPAPARYDDPAG